ncbi:MAG: SHOCT domain-containing protein [Candidatus Dormibacteraeota bacterium]|nr:SHOCT domain-containing protein [Candidatus Dormibacteraeota bacterium]
MIFVIIFPFLGVFIYLVSQGSGMTERDARQAQAAQEQFGEYIQSVAGTGGPAAEIDRAKRLLDNGAITQAEFDSLKRKALA